MISMNLCMFIAAITIQTPVAVMVAERIQEINPRITETQADEIAHAVAVASCEYNVDAGLMLAVIQTESSFRPNVSGDGGSSWGLMQINYPAWADEFPTDLKKSRKTITQVRAGAYALFFWRKWAKDTKEYQAPLLWINHYNSGIWWKAGLPWAQKVTRYKLEWEQIFKEAQTTNTKTQELEAEDAGDTALTSGAN